MLVCVANDRFGSHFSAALIRCTSDDNCNMFHQLLFFVLAILSFYLVNDTVHEPYMDEYFHITQTQAYCHGRYEEWNDKITTLPGMYWAIVAMVRAVGLRTCALHVLRGLNCQWIFCLMLVTVALRQRLYANDHSSSAAAFEILMFPIQFFFYFLFYTDTSSTTLVLFMYLLSLHQSHYFAAVVGGVAVLFRQNNIIWVIFTMCMCIVRSYELGMYSGGASNISKQLYQPQTPTQLLETIPNMLSCLWKSWRIVLSQTIGYILVGVGFGVFIIYNGGVVVGDRSNHMAVFHGVQSLYFFAIVLIFQPLFTLRYIKPFLRALVHNPLATLVAAALFTLLVHYCTFEHPFLLADNRHVSFYVWKNLFRRWWWARYVYIPVYMYGAWLTNTLLSTRSLLWRIVFFACVALFLTPSPLFEFRYFIQPFVLLKLHTPSSSSSSSGDHLWHTLYAACISLIVLFVFTQRPFRWPDGSIARFMW